MTCAVVGNIQGAEPPRNGVGRTLDPRLQTFFAAKERHARSLAKEFQVKAAPEMWQYFDAGIQGDWLAVRKLWRDLSKRSGQYTSGGPDPAVSNLVWPPLLEAELAYECFGAMDMKFVDAFARGTIDSIPRNAIYFGGTDPGRGVITAFVKSHADADPFFVLTQNALADGLYLKYIDAIYGRKIHVPDEADSRKAFEEYKAGAAARLDEGRLKPGEKVVRKDGKVEFSGAVAVMEINALLARIIFDRNPAREFYIEESFVLDWMYPHLSPHGWIMKLNRKPLSELSEKVLQQDREYWRKQTAQFVGDWLNEETPLKKVCEFVERVYRDGDLEGFKGDALYVSVDRASSPRPLFGKLRHAHANLYEWRLHRAATPTEKSAMTRAAELAYKQTFVLSPDSSEFVRRFVVLLKEQKRLGDARQVLATGLQINPGSKRLAELSEELQSSP